MDGKPAAIYGSARFPARYCPIQNEERDRGFGEVTDTSARQKGFSRRLSGAPVAAHLLQDADGGGQGDAKAGDVRDQPQRGQTAADTRDHAPRHGSRVVSHHVAHRSECAQSDIFYAFQRDCAEISSIQLANYNVKDKKQGAWHHDESSDMSVVCT